MEGSVLRGWQVFAIQQDWLLLWKMEYHVEWWETEVLLADVPSHQPWETLATYEIISPRPFPEHDKENSNYKDNAFPTTLKIFPKLSEDTRSNTSVKDGWQWNLRFNNHSFLGRDVLVGTWCSYEQSSMSQSCVSGEFYVSILWWLSWHCLWRQKNIQMSRFACFLQI